MNSTFNNLVIFTALKSANFDANYIINANETITFDETETNIGNGMDPSTGIFTVLVSGTYSFSFSGSYILPDAGSQNVLLRVYQTDVSETIQTIDLYGYGAVEDLHLSVSYTWTMSLDQSDEMYLKLPNNSFMGSDRFYGQLLN